jgi:hypothetical protein
MHRRHRFSSGCCWLLLCALLGSCSSGKDESDNGENGSGIGVTGPSGSSGGGATSLPTEATDIDLMFCVAETNRYRTSVGKSQLTRSSDLEAFATAGAQEDGQKHQAHAHFDRLFGGPAFAENELPWWPIAQFQTVQETLRQGIAVFYQEGPGGGHYQNLLGPYTQVGCGVYIANGEITVVQDFR